MMFSNLLKLYYKNIEELENQLKIFLRQTHPIRVKLIDQKKKIACQGIPPPQKKKTAVDNQIITKFFLNSSVISIVTKEEEEGREGN